MRLGVVFPHIQSAAYRAIDPMKAMEARGHDVVWPEADGTIHLDRLARCDVVHVYRDPRDEIRQAMVALARAGVAITYDNDDDLRSAASGQQLHAMTVKAARLATTFTTSTEPLAEIYRRAGVKRIEVIDNHVRSDLPRPLRRHRGVVVGWFGHPGHRVNAQRLGIPETLRTLLGRHRNVRVECIGLDLELPERYRHDPTMPFEQLVPRIGGFDIGIAPLADLPMNHGRSSIKIKEYAACGVPWLASPVGGCAGYGEREGGRLVADDGWLEALGRLVTDRRERRRLARNAQEWAKSQTIDVGAERWERVFTRAAGG